MLKSESSKIKELRGPLNPKESNDNSEDFRFIIRKENGKIAVMGLGYVGFCRNLVKNIILLDLILIRKESKTLREGNDYNGEMSKEDLFLI